MVIDSTDTEADSIIMELNGIHELHPDQQRQLAILSEVLGADVISDIWDLYHSTGLINEDGTMWGNRDPEGRSIGPIPHSILVSVAELRLCEELGLGTEMMQTLGIVGLVHDAHKRIEVESKDPEATHGIASGRLSEMFGPEIAELASLSGHTAMPKVLTRFNDVKSLIVFWVDNVVVGREITSVRDKCDYLDRMAAEGRYSYNDEGIDIYGVPYFTFQRYLATVIEARLVQMGQTLGTLEGLRSDQLAEKLRLLVGKTD